MKSLASHPSRIKYLEMMARKQLVAGVDEVGRGPIAGPVVAAAVILDADKSIEGLNDSKKLSQKKREALAIEIKQQALAWSIGRVDVDVIDQINILQASMLAMKIALESLFKRPQFVFVDGNRNPDVDIPCETVVKGDYYIPAISAASILAKVNRDNEMVEMDQRYPGYGFAQHKGYPTKSHMQSLAELGPLSIHRKSFAPVKIAIENQLELELG